MNIPINKDHIYTIPCVTSFHCIYFELFEYLNLNSSLTNSNLNFEINSNIHIVFVLKTYQMYVCENKSSGFC